MTRAKSLDGHGAFRGEREAQGAPAGEVGARESEEIGPEQRLCAPGSARQIRGWEPVRRPGASVWDRRGPGCERERLECSGFFLGCQLYGVMTNARY